MVTISDVARAAGVSTSTVSYVLSAKRPISASTRERVEASIRELGYHPHAGARSLAGRRTNVLALVAPLRRDVNVPVVMQFATSIVVAAREHDHDVLLLTQDEGADGLHRVVRTALVDALVVMDVESTDPRIDVLATLGTPSVLIGVPDDPQGLCCVDLDFAAAGRLCVEHLTGLGHRTIALLGPTPAVYERGTSYASRFLSGFDSAAAASGARAAAQPCEATFEGVSRWLDDVLARMPDLTGLVVHNEAALAPLLTQLHSRGLEVPGDVSIVALCPEDVAAHAQVPLTAVELPTAEVGSRAVSMVMRLLDGDGTPETRLVEPTLVERRSCAAPRR